MIYQPALKISYVGAKFPADNAAQAVCDKHERSCALRGRSQSLAWIVANELTVSVLSLRLASDVKNF